MHITDSKQVWGFHIDSFQEGATTNYLLASGNWLGRLSKQANQQIQQTNQNISKWYLGPYNYSWNIKTATAT